MIASNEFLWPDLSHVAASTPLDDLGPVELEHPTQDIDGDGRLDTLTQSTDEAMVVATDSDLDGYADYLTIVDKAGDYAAWEHHDNEDGTSHWERTDHGSLGE